IAEAILRDEQAVIPIASYNPKYGVTLSLPSVLGRHGVSQVFEPEMSEEERQGLQRNADILQNAVARMNQLLAQTSGSSGGPRFVISRPIIPRPLAGSPFSSCDLLPWP